jgi:hypothetical protein
MIDFWFQDFLPMGLVFNTDSGNPRLGLYNFSRESGQPKTSSRAYQANRRLCMAKPQPAPLACCLHQLPQEHL